jgi:hypothetical protein
MVMIMNNEFDSILKCEDLSSRILAIKRDRERLFERRPSASPRRLEKFGSKFDFNFRAAVSPVVAAVFIEIVVYSEFARDS